MAPAIAALLEALRDSFHKASAAAARSSAVPSPSIATSGGKTPAAASASRIGSLASARMAMPLATDCREPLALAWSSATSARRRACMSC